MFWLYFLEAVVSSISIQLMSEIEIHICIHTPMMKEYVQKAYKWCMCMPLSVSVWRKARHLTQLEMWQHTTEVMLGRNRCCRRVNLSVDQLHPPTQYIHKYTPDKDQGRKEATERCAFLKIHLLHKHQVQCLSL